MKPVRSLPHHGGMAPARRRFALIAMALLLGATTVAPVQATPVSTRVTDVTLEEKPVDTLLGKLRVPLLEGMQELPVPESENGEYLMAFVDPWRTAILTIMENHAGKTSHRDNDPMYFEAASRRWIQAHRTASPNFKLLGQRTLRVDKLGVYQIDAYDTPGNKHFWSTTWFAASGTVHLTVDLRSIGVSQAMHDARVQAMITAMGAR